MNEIKSNNNGGDYVDPNTLNLQLKNYVDIREMHDYISQEIKGNNELVDNKLSNYVKHEELNKEMIELLKEKNATFKFWIPIIISVIVSVGVAYFNSHK